MNKHFWTFTGLIALICSSFALVQGQGHLTYTGILMFTLLSLFVPLVIRRMARFEFAVGFTMNMWYHVYAWAWWNLFFFMGTGGVLQLAIPTDNVLAIGALWFVVYVAVVVLIELTALLLTAFFDRERKHDLIDTTLDLSMYTLPVPLLLTGNVLYVDMYSNPMMAMYLSQTMAKMLQLCAYALIFLTMMSTVFYLFPRNGADKFPRLVRIFVTALMWLAINGHMLYGYIPPMMLDWIFVAVPVFRANPLVYVTPAIFEVAVIFISVVLGYYVEKSIIQYKSKGI